MTDLTISGADSMTAFHRLIVINGSLNDLFAVDSSLHLVAVEMRNDSGGCWLAFTSFRVARRVLTTLVAAGFSVTSDICDRNGITIQ